MYTQDPRKDLIQKKRVAVVMSTRMYEIGSLLTPPPALDFLRTISLILDGKTTNKAEKTTAFVACCLAVIH